MALGVGQLTPGYAGAILMSVLIIGAGICGLGTALLLARDGHDVTVLERDADPVPDSLQDAWDGWPRKGIAQFRQPHNFMPGLRLQRSGETRQCQGTVLADWVAAGPDGQPRGRGTNVFVFGPDGRIESVTGFWA